MRRLLVLIALLVANFASAQVSTVPPGSTSAVFTGGTITTPILGVPGDCVTVPYSFTGATTTGFSRASLTDAAVVCVGGAEIFRVNALGPIAQLRLQIIAGTAAAPGVVFTGGTTTGLYHVSPGIGFSVVGASVGTWTATALTSTAPFLAPDGTAGAPSHSFTSEAALGMFRRGVGALSFAASGTEALIVSGANVLVRPTSAFRLSGGVEFGWAPADALVAGADVGLARSAAAVVKVTDGSTGDGSLQVANGTAAAPSYSFTGAATTGMFHVGANILGLASGGTGYFAITTDVAELKSSSQLAWSTGLIGASVDTGLARSAAGVVKLTDGGVGNGSLRVAAGNTTTPGLAFATTTNLGFYDIGSNQLALAAAGTTPLVFQSAYVNTSGQYGFSTNPAAGAPDTGLARNAAGIVGVTNGSTGSGKLDVGNAGFLTLEGSAGSAAGISQPAGATNHLIFIEPGGIASKFNGFYFRSPSIGLEMYTGTPYIGLNGAYQLRDSAAVTRFSGTGAGTTLGYTLSGQVVEANAATKAPTIVESGELYTNTGDGDGSIINLPDDPTIGTQFRVALTVAQTVTINAAAGESIQDAGTNAASRAASAIGDSIHLIAVTGGSGAVWMVVSKTGTWS